MTVSRHVGPTKQPRCHETTSRFLLQTAPCIWGGEFPVGTSGPIAAGENVGSFEGANGTAVAAGGAYEACSVVAGVRGLFVVADGSVNGHVAVAVAVADHDHDHDHVHVHDHGS